MIGPACRLQLGRRKRLIMKKAIQKLRVNKQTIRVLAADEVAQAAGGWIRPPITWSCPQPGLAGPKDELVVG
jgi:hypothetical protein